MINNYSELDGSSFSSSSPNSSSEVNMLASENPKKRTGRRIFHETRHPVYRGVRRRNKDKWVSEMRVPNDNKSRIWLGTYTTPEMAARAHDVASLTLRGKSACLNFADSAWRVTLPDSTDPVDIRKAASIAALMFSGDENNRPPQQQQEMMIEEEEEVAPVISNMRMFFSDEPILSPSPSETDLSHWYGADIFDDPVSLWNF